MDDNAKNSSSYQLDQEILDARGINMTVEEVAGLPTCKYSERVQSLKLSDDDLAFLKGLRRRIKNRLASQNSRRRSVEHLRQLTRELRAVRASRHDVLSERRALLSRRDEVRDQCSRLRRHIVQILQDRTDVTEVPAIDIAIVKTESQPKPTLKLIPHNQHPRPLKHEKPPLTEYRSQGQIKTVFECRLDKLVTQSVNHIYKDVDRRRIFAKTVFIAKDNLTTDIHTVMLNEGEFLGEDSGVLNLSVKEGRRRSHGRKQPAPRRIPCCLDNDDGVLDLKIKKEPQEMK